MTDTGVGISEEDLSNLFKPFFRSKDKLSLEHNKNGNGLGLHICQNILRQLNGKISVQSTQGKGSTFTVSFKTVKADREAQFEGQQVSRNSSLFFRGEPTTNKEESTAR